MANLKHICVLRLSALGDCINAFGFIGGLKKADPNPDISMIIDKPFASMFKDAKNNDLIPLYTVDFKNEGLKSILSLKKELKGKTFDALLNIQTSIKASLLSLAVKAPLKIGYDKARSREGQRFFVNKTAPASANPHVLAGFISFAKALGYDNVTPYWDFKLEEAELSEMRNQLPDKPIFVIAPASAKAEKNWTIEGYSALAKLALKKGFVPVLLGSKAPLELNLSKAIADTAGDGVINLCGKTTLRQMLCILKIAKLALCPDSGTMHAASAVGTPVIGLFARHSEKRVGPWNYMNLCVSVYDKLAKSELNGKDAPWRYRVKQNNAMEQITIDAVKDMFLKVLKEMGYE